MISPPAVLAFCILRPLPTIESTYLSQSSLDMAASWKQLQTGLASLNLGQSANKLAKGFNSSVQATKERLGQVAAEDITELPQGAHHAVGGGGGPALTPVLPQSTRTSRHAWMRSAPRTSPSSSASAPARESARR